MRGNGRNANPELVSGQALQRAFGFQAGQLKVLLHWRNTEVFRKRKGAKNKKVTLNKPKGARVRCKRNTKMRFPPPDLFLMTGRHE